MLHAGVEVGEHVAGGGLHDRRVRVGLRELRDGRHRRPQREHGDPDQAVLRPSQDHRPAMPRPAAERREHRGSEVLQIRVRAGRGRAGRPRADDRGGGRGHGGEDTGPVHMLHMNSVHD